MKKALLVLGLLAGIASAEVEVSVAGIRVVDGGYTSEGEEKKMNADLRAFNWTKGTTIALLIKSKGKAIVGMDEDGSKITTFGDDKETDFTKAKGRFGRKGVSFGFANFSDDQKALMTEVTSSGIPAKGAKSLSMKGELLVSVASKSELKKSKATAVKKGEKVVVGEHSFEITEAGKPDWGDEPLSIGFKSSVDHKDFKAFKFYDAEGKEIESKRSSSGSMGMFGKKTYTVTFNLKKKVSQVIVGLDGWTDLEVIKVPVDLTVGVGL